VGDAASQVTDAAPALRQGGREEGRAGQGKCIEEDERRDAGQVESDDADAGVRQERDGQDRRACRVRDGEERRQGVVSSD
jgi:hypothetical protein